jgi:hypothetical protein
MGLPFIVSAPEEGYAGGTLQQPEPVHLQRVRDLSPHAGSLLLPSRPDQSAQGSSI